MIKIKKSRLIWYAVGAVAVIIIIALLVASSNSNKPGNLDSFAKCLTESGAKFYGASWCSHCQAQKLEFGKSVEFMPYVECSTPDGQSQMAVCARQNITSYPTWVFPDGSRESGKLSLQELAYKTNCVLPK
jgi:large repetitive protein